jgi:apolipoprotein N-acyltransferase
MLQIIIEHIGRYIRAKNRWWIPVFTGLLFSLSQPPFNHTFNPVFFFFPCLSFIIIIPLLVFATEPSLKKSMVQSALFGFFASISQYYWIGFVTAEGLWHLILIGVVLIAIFFGFFYFVAAMIFRVFLQKFPRLYLLFFPAVWICIDYIRTLGEISFPWSFLGYSLAPFLPLAQIVSVTGVWGLTFLVVLTNCLIWDLLKSYMTNSDIVPRWINLSVLALFFCGISIWGAFRISGGTRDSRKINISLIQSNLNQLHWGVNSLDTAFSITDSMITEASLQKPDLIIGPESALLCFLSRRSEYRNRVVSWVNSIHTPLLLGGLHWDKAPEGSSNDYLVYNSAFLFKPDTLFPLIYNKIKLVPFSEALPFEGVFPILSRTNLGEADFKRGKQQIVLKINDSLRVAPFICYEIIYPGFVRDRVKTGTDLIVTITNDGWFGKTSGPYQHAGMAQIRAVENGRPLVRCANSGISMVVDMYGSVANKTPIYIRQILNGRVDMNSANTIYLQWGDWFVVICLIVSLVALIWGLILPFFVSVLVYFSKHLKKKSS